MKSIECSAAYGRSVEAYLRWWDDDIYLVNRVTDKVSDVLDKDAPGRAVLFYLLGARLPYSISEWEQFMRLPYSTSEWEQFMRLPEAACFPDDGSLSSGEGPVKYSMLQVFLAEIAYLIMLFRELYNYSVYLDEDSGPVNVLGIADALLDVYRGLSNSIVPSVCAAKFIYTLLARRCFGNYTERFCVNLLYRIFANFSFIERDQAVSCEESLRSGKNYFLFLFENGIKSLGMFTGLLRVVSSEGLKRDYPSMFSISSHGT